MGLWNFVKNAGKSLGIGTAEAAETSEPDTQAAAGALKAEVDSLGLDSDGLKIEIDGDTVKMTGKAKSQEEKEKAILAVGNIAGVATVEETVEAPEAREPVFHTVEKGDTLWAIASKTLGNGARYTEIFEANKPMLSDPDKIYPGQMLRIPQD